ncbi:MAG: hypothetical protein AAGK00_02390 [Pseudomonadota bacterium]
MFRPKSFHIPASQRTKILWLYSSSVPGEVRFTATPTDPTASLNGTVELHRKRWFTWHRDDYPLSARMTLPKGMSDGDYRVYVTPDQDTDIQFQTRHARAEIFFVILACVVGLGLVAGSRAFMFGP